MNWPLQSQRSNLPHSLLPPYPLMVEDSPRLEPEPELNLVELVQ